MSGRDEPVHEHEFEAAHGLPEPLPAGEHILWQGSPEFASMARRCFHLGTVGIYFAVILTLRAGFAAAQGATAVEALLAAAWLLPPVVIALGILALMAYLSSRTSVYTITDRRVVMRVGIVLSLTFNLPYARIVSADARLKGGSTGDIALSLGGSDHIAYVHLWPHARPWKLARTQPMLRCVANAERVSQVLAGAWRAAHDVAPQPLALVPVRVTEARPAARALPLGARLSA